MFCKKCNVEMKHVHRFENGKAYELYRCPKCWYESRKLPLFIEETKLKQNVVKNTKRRRYKRRELKR